MIETLQNKGIIPNGNYELIELKSGTTSGRVYLIAGEEKFVLKYDQPIGIGIVERFYEAYRTIDLFPKVYAIDLENGWILYEYIDGTTHTNRGPKSEWMNLLVTRVLNQYKPFDPQWPWGRVGGEPRSTWSDFNRKSLEYAYENIGDLLPNEDYSRMESIVEELAMYDVDEVKYYLHGDMGVHNFVFKNDRMAGVIDPSPLVGPILYDFTYAFCSSPDDLTVEALLSSFELLDSVHMETSRLIKEVVFQLYTRIGICKQAHPHDLDAYLQAWAYWKRVLESKSSEITMTE
ncbi:phosphotransferase [Sporosarcina cyprini]|uniref:phosphotransferase n=1 Tax=Sporosarcina cyprini TaxID=2910523 RepID=UPI001EDE786E|nr:phosphotransferase [Sporosarcina cyprini]MCG3087197.1 aminoglycoside phosphotransferase family protein [Sporosarcina cyprini]